MHFEQVTITTGLAKEMLSRNCKNRSLSALRVSKYADDIKNGKWTVSTNPICFDSNGTLLDGQHRLNAVIQANIPVVMTIAYDVPTDAVIDKGMERNTGDSLYMRGLISIKSSRRDYVAVAKRYIEISHGRIYTDSRIADFLNENETIIEKAISISSFGAHKAICKKAPVQAAICGALKCNVSPDTLLKFCTVANSGFMDNEFQSSAIVLRQFLSDERIRGSGISNELCAFAQMEIRDFTARIPRRQKYRKLEHVYIRNGGK